MERVQYGPNTLCRVLHENDNDMAASPTLPSSRQADTCDLGQQEDGVMFGELLLHVLLSLQSAPVLRFQVPKLFNPLSH